MDPSRLPCLFQWKREYTMETILIELRRQDATTSIQYADLTNLSQIYGITSAQEASSAPRRFYIHMIIIEKGEPDENGSRRYEKHWTIRLLALAGVIAHMAKLALPISGH